MSAVPPGLESLAPLFPALKRWARFDRPSGAGFSRPPLRGWIMLCFVPLGCWKTGSHSHAGALRHPKSTAAGEGARATQNRVIAMGLGGAAQSGVPSKQLQNLTRWADVESHLQKTKGGAPRRLVMRRGKGSGQECPLHTRSRSLRRRGRASRRSLSDLLRGHARKV